MQLLFSCLTSWFFVQSNFPLARIKSCTHQVKYIVMPLRKIVLFKKAGRLMTQYCWDFSFMGYLLTFIHMYLFYFRVWKNQSAIMPILGSEVHDTLQRSTSKLIISLLLTLKKDVLWFWVHSLVVDYYLLYFLFQKVTQSTTN